MPINNYIQLPAMPNLSAAFGGPFAKNTQLVFLSSGYLPNVNIYNGSQFVILNPENILMNPGDILIPNDNTFTVTASAPWQGGSNVYVTYSQVITTADYFSSRPSVSASFPPFSGIDITDFTNIVQNQVLVNLYALSALGFFNNSTNNNYDIIFVNVAGYSKISDFGNIFYVNTAA
jgi:hypothetical protein